MPLLPARHYVSDHTRFIRDLLEKKPQLETEQRIGRAIWWDKLPADLEANRDMDEGRVAQKPYGTRTTTRSRPRDRPRSTGRARPRMKWRGVPIRAVANASRLVASGAGSWNTLTMRNSRPSSSLRVTIPRRSPASVDWRRRRIVNESTTCEAPGASRAAPSPRTTRTVPAARQKRSRIAAAAATEQVGLDVAHVGRGNAVD
jgi:hypothetical protein